MDISLYLLEPTFADLVKHLESVNDWHKLGAFLLPKENHAQMSVIKTTYKNDVNECKMALFELYLRIGDVSWTTVVSALENANYPNIAAKIKQEFY